MCSIAETGRGIAGGNLTSLSFASFFPLLSLTVGLPIATGKDGPIVDTLGGHGPTLPKRVSAGFQRGVDSACFRRAIRTLCRDGFNGGGLGGGG